MSRARVLCAATIVAALAAPAGAAYYHDLPNNRQPCSDCHILHYSEGGGTPSRVEAGGPFPQLKIRSSTNKLCLFCHDGSDPKAPDVIDPVTMYASTGDESSGAGFFANSGGIDNPNGHDLGVSKPVPFGSATNVVLTCASCHDPHGTPNYRNVVTAPAGGTGIGVEMGQDVYRLLPPGDPPSAAGSAAAYKQSNEGYKAKTSKWCIECHDQLRQSESDPTRVADSHLVDVPINGVGYPTSPGHWAGGTGAGFGTTTGDDVEGIPRLRFQVSGATDYGTSKVAAQGNEVMCMTCHFAHGGRWQKGLVWPYLDGTADMDSGCQQCHQY
jgi:hypothetical protein